MPNAPVMFRERPTEGTRKNLMVDVRSHYDDHLGPIYEWYTGPFESACLASRRLFAEIELSPVQSGVAVDFGSGHGLQAVPLAELGFEVIAIDTCAELLRSLEERRGSLPIRTLVSDISSCADELPDEIDVAVCCGDTLTHLESRDAVESWVERTAHALVPGGSLVLTFRDYATAPLAENARFIPVRSDADRILTCFLEYGKDRVGVHDIVHERSKDGWSMNVSRYEKLRLDPRWVASLMQKAGLTISIDRMEQGVVALTARRGESECR
jgi:SAM-dependent methyltransferase